MASTDEQRVIEALRFAGLNIESVFDLVNTSTSYKPAIPILIRLLPEVTDATVKEGIVRALSTRDARGVAAKPLLHELRKLAASGTEADDLLKWTVANALSVVADDGVFDEIVSLVHDHRLGKAREMLALALARMTDTPEAVDALISLLADDQVNGHAARALGILRVERARPELEQLLNDSRSWVRQEAKKALSKLERAST